jgi:hypothetical protein
MGAQSKAVNVVVEWRDGMKHIFTDLENSFERQQLTAKSAMAADLATIDDCKLSEPMSKGLMQPIENAEQSERFQRMVQNGKYSAL